MTKQEEAMQKARQRFKGMNCSIKDDGGFVRVQVEDGDELRIIRAIDADVDGNTLSLSFSSEAPVATRWGDVEILSHDEEDADLSRLRDVGSILKNHNADQIVGKPIRVWIDESQRKGRLEMEFGSTDMALQAKQEVDDGTLRGVSVGFLVREWIWLSDEDTVWKDRFTGPAWIAAKWEALEASLTPIPADPTVGVNRSQRKNEKPKENTMTDAEKKRKAEEEARKLEDEAKKKTSIFSKRYAKR